MVKVEAYHDGEMWCARGLGADIFTQGSSFEELIANLREAVALHFEGEAPQDFGPPCAGLGAHCVRPAVPTPRAPGARSAPLRALPAFLRQGSLPPAS
jgi:hypothetical protein